MLRNAYASKGCLQHFQGFRGYECFPMVITGFQWLSGVSNGYRGFPMVIGGFQWLSGVSNPLSPKGITYRTSIQNLK